MVGSPLGVAPLVHIIKHPGFEHLITTPPCPIALSIVSIRVNVFSAQAPIGVLAYSDIEHSSLCASLQKWLFICVSLLLTRFGLSMYGLKNL